jgi:peptidoglycan/xylan/chitin deacetylase (PgdA/CDA1 family)
MDVIVVCHTEYGRVRGREVVYDKSAVEGVTRGVRSLAAVASRHGAKITFAVMPEVAQHFPGGLDHEVGLHVHPGSEKVRCGGEIVRIGDEYLQELCPSGQTSSALRDYSYEEQLALIGAGKDCIEDSLGTTPTVFVAGRWSVNNDTIRALIRSGFTHDCSAVPAAGPAHYDWSRLPRICMPYRPDDEDYQRPGGASLLVVPVSRSMLGASVTPELAPRVGLPWLKACFTEYYRQALPLFHIYLHSPCMTDPYFVGAMDGLLEFIARHDVTFRFASEVREYEGASPRAVIRPYLAGLNLNMLGATGIVCRRLASATAARVRSVVS